jgi:hypothetical protein
MKTLKEFLEEINACEDARTWASDKTIEQVVKECHRGDWLLWLSRKVEINLQTRTLAKALCAKTVIHLMKDERSRKAIEVAEAFGRGNATREELDAAYYAADAAADAADAAYYAAADAADAAYYAAAAAADAADAAYYAAAAAYYAAAAADAAYYAAAAIKNNQMTTADICREIMGDILIEKVNDLLN